LHALLLNVWIRIRRALRGIDLFALLCYYIQTDFYSIHREKVRNMNLTQSETASNGFPVVAVIIAILVIIIAVILVITFRRLAAKKAADELERAKFERQNAHIIAWLKKTGINASDQERVDAGAPPSGWNTQFNDEVQRALEDQEWSRINLEEIAEVATAVATIRSGSMKPGEELVALNKVLKNGDLISTEDLEWMKARVQTKGIEAGAELLAAAREGDAASFKELRKHHRDGLWPAEGEKRPDDWNDLVARFIKNPKFRTFKGLDEDPKAGDLRLKAVAALRSESLKEAKIVLAYCNYTDVWRKEVGELLVNDLAKLVDRLTKDSTNTISDPTVG